MEGTKYPSFVDITLKNVRISGGGKISLNGFSKEHRVGVNTPVSPGLSSVSGVAIGSGGTLIIAGTDSTGELQLVTGGSAAATFGSVAVGSTGSPVPFRFTVAGATTISAISVMTMGPPARTSPRP